MRRDRQFYPPPIEITETDAGDVANLYARCLDYFLLQDGEAPTFADARDLFSHVPLDKKPQDQTVFGWRETERLYALAAILQDYPLKEIWYLGFMIVDPAFRGRGVGHSIYSAIEDHAALLGANEIRLAVLEQNEPGARFWRSLGFEEVRRVGPDPFKKRSHHRIELSRRVNAGLTIAAPQ